MRILAAALFLLFALLAFVGPAKAVSSEDSFRNATNYMARENYFAAIQELEKAVLDSPDNIEYKTYLTYLYYIRGDVQKARALCEQILAVNDNGLLIFLILADLTYKDSDLGRALELYHKARSINPNIKIVNIRLYELLKYEDKVEANKYYLRSLELEKTDLSDYLPFATMSRKILLGLNESVDLVPDLSPQVNNETNNIVQYFLSPSGQEPTLITGGETNVILQTKVKGKFKLGVHLFRKFDHNVLFTKIIETLFILVISFMLSWANRKKRKKASDVVYTSYRKK